MAAVTLARYGVDFRIIDQRAETIQGGQAGGKSREPPARFSVVSFGRERHPQGRLPLLCHLSRVAAFVRLNTFILVSQLEEQRL